MRSAITLSSGRRYLNFGFPSNRLADASIRFLSHSMSLVPYFEFMVLPVTRILAIAIRMLKREMWGIRLLVSYADLDHGHLGKIYHASNWVYVGALGFCRAF